MTMRASILGVAAASVMLAQASGTSTGLDKRGMSTCHIPPVSEASSPLPPSYISLSIEFQFFPNFTGNASHPNHFSLGLIEEIADHGDPLFLRLGGSTQDRVLYNLTFPHAISPEWTYWWESNPIRGIMGPAYFDGIDLLPSSFKYVFGVNEGGFNNSDGMHDPALTLANIKRQAVTAYEKIGDQLWAIEPGNEVSGFNHSYEGVWWRDPQSRWEQVDFTRDFNDTYDTLQGPVIPGDPHRDQSANPMWRAGDASGFKPGWQFSDVWQTGSNAWNRLREFSVHNYPKTICSASIGATLTIENAMLDHDVISTTLESYRSYADYTAEQGVEFVLGETNSISCQGKPGVSDAFAAALWTFDWALYSAVMGVKRVYYHTGPSFPYAAIWPTKYNGTEPSVRGGYYGMIMAAKAFGSTAKGTSGKRVANFINETNVAAYALYTSDEPQWAHPEWYGDDGGYGGDYKKASWRVSDLAFLNMRPFNQSSPQPSRGKLTFPIGKQWNGARVTRVTAAGADTLPITFGKAPYLESHAEEGEMSVGCITYVSGQAERIPGCKDEVVKNGHVTVMDSEAILVSRD